MHDAAHRRSWPTQRGFDRFYGVLEGLTSLLHPHRLVSDNDPVAVDTYPEGYHLTEDLTDRAVGWIRALRAHHATKPLFVYLAHPAVHAPLQAPAGATAADRAAIETFGPALAGTGKPFVIASGILGVLGLPPGVVASERDGLAAPAEDGTVPISGANDRVSNAHLTLALADRGIRASVVRLPPTTHGDGDNGFIATAIRLARDKGAAAFVDDGANRWPSVHRDDAARMFRLALEAAPPGSVLHAVGDEGGRSARSPRSWPHSWTSPPSPSAPRRSGSTSASSAGPGDSTAPLGADHPRPARLGTDPPRTDPRPQARPLLRGASVRFRRDHPGLR